MASSVIENHKPLQVLTGTTGAANAGVSMRYPNGFTVDNCVVVGIQYKNPSENLWRTMGSINPNNSSVLTATMTSAEILIVPRTSDAAYSQFKVSLYRYQ